MFDLNNSPPVYTSILLVLVGLAGLAPAVLASDAEGRFVERGPVIILRGQTTEVGFIFDNTSTFGGGPFAVNGRVRFKVEEGLGILRIVAGETVCENTNGALELECSIGNVPAGQSRTVMTTIIGNDGGTFSVAGLVSSNLTDPDPSNNQDTIQITVLDPRIAYVRQGAAGPGMLNAPDDPFPGIQEAVDQQPNQVLISPGVFETFMVSDRDLGIEFGGWSGMPTDSGSTTVEDSIVVDGSAEFLNSDVRFKNTIRNFWLTASIDFRDSNFDYEAPLDLKEPARVEVGGSLDQDFTWSTWNGNRLTVKDDFRLGADEGMAPSAGLFSVGGGKLLVKGDFTVGPNLSDESQSEVDRNRFSLGGGRLRVKGNFSFRGTGDRYDDDSFPAEDQGLQGTVVFASDTVLNILQRQAPDAYLNNVKFAGRGPFRLRTDLELNSDGRLHFRKGLIVPDTLSNEIVVRNLAFEDSVNSRFQTRPFNGSITSRSRLSYSDAGITRLMGYDGMPPLTSGYLFPVGSSIRERPDDVGTPRDADFFRPLILQFPDDLGLSPPLTAARVDFRPDAGIRGDQGLLGLTDEAYVEIAGDTLVLGQEWWTVQFSPSFVPTERMDLRVGLQLMPNLYDISQLRLLEFSCPSNGSTGEFVGLAGDPVAAISDSLNDFVYGVPNLAVSGVQPRACAIYGLGSRRNANPIGNDEIPEDLAPIQFTNFSDDKLDFYLGARLKYNDVEPQSAAPVLVTDTASALAAIVPYENPDNSGPLASKSFSSAPDGKMRQSWYDGIELGASYRLFGGLKPFEVRFSYVNLTEDTLSVTASDGMGAAESTEPIYPGMISTSLRFQRPYRSMTESGYMRGIDRNGVNPIEGYGYPDFGITHRVISKDGADLAALFSSLFNYSEEDFTAVIREVAPRKRQSPELVVFDSRGDMLEGKIVTSVEDDRPESPTSFVLEGNYPNPFSDRTTIAFVNDRPVPVAIEIYDIVGRRIATLADQLIAEGRQEVVWDGRGLDGSKVSPGVYFYRLKRDEMVVTGKMVLVK